MVETAAELPIFDRIADRITPDMLTRWFPLEKVQEALAATHKGSQRQRALPAHLMVYYVMALSLWRADPCREVLRWLMEGLRWLGLGIVVKIPVKSAISQARTRLGSEVMVRLCDAVVGPIAQPATKGAWYRHWHVVSIDGSTLDVADEPMLEKTFGRPGASRGDSAFPQIRFVSLVENGTHVMFATKMSGCHTSEIALAKLVLPRLCAGMLALADRNFFGFELWTQAQATGADLLWRVKKNTRLPIEQRLPDGSYISSIYPSDTARRRKTQRVKVRVIEYRLEGVADTEPLYRLITTILDHEKAPAHELAALYHERWEIETAIGEIKTALRGAQTLLRSKTPDLVIQEFFGMMMMHFVVRGLMHEAALKADEDPDHLSFIHTVRVIRRNLPKFLAFSPSGLAKAA